MLRIAPRPFDGTYPQTGDKVMDFTDKKDTTHVPPDKKATIIDATEAFPAWEEGRILFNKEHGL
jgi:hypothetical protein